MVPVGGSGDVICDWSGATPGDRAVDGGKGVSVWASALPVSKANPSAAIADNLIMFIVLLPVGDFRAELGARQKSLISAIEKMRNEVRPRLVALLV